MAYYVVHPGFGKAAPDATQSYIDGSELAALYGLGVGEYEVGNAEVGSLMDSHHIHLVPRPDGLYRSIKTELGDNGTDFHIDKMVNPEKWNRRNRDNDIKRYRS